MLRGGEQTGALFRAFGTIWSLGRPRYAAQAPDSATSFLVVAPFPCLGDLATEEGHHGARDVARRSSHSIRDSPVGPRLTPATPLDELAKYHDMWWFDVPSPRHTGLARPQLTPEAADIASTGGTPWRPQRATS